MKSFNKYASLKTSGQLVMDLGSITTHICALVSLLRTTDVNQNQLTQFFCWFLVAVIIFQTIVAIGLYIFRFLDIDHVINHETAKRWNIVFFVAVFIISICEAFIGVFEKFGLEHGPSVINGTSPH